MSKKIRVVLARLGLDAHWRGSVVVGRALRDAGMEVIYMGNQMPDAIVKTVVEEDASVVGLSSLSGNHMVLAPEVAKLLRAHGMDQTTIVLGGTVPSHDVPALKQAGISEVFGPGASLQAIVDFIKRNAKLASAT